jgi:predicted transcriptional regulator
VERDWSFFTNYGLALLLVARHPDSRIRDVAEALGITERAAQGILSDLVEEGYLERVRVGRRNRYIVRGDRMLRHPTTRDHSVAELVRALGVKVAGDPGRRGGRRAG